MTRARIQLTQLEDRANPATFGFTWVNADNITYSIVPDGTDVAGVKSNLKATLNARMPEATWTEEIREAFQEWANVANLEISPTWDWGQPLGSAAPIQSSPSFGDIRVSARPLSDNVLAITNPPDMFSPWAGEIILNSNKVFTLDGANGTASLRTVLRHEAAHALGLAPSTDPSSIMYEDGGGSVITSGDIAAMRALYGNRKNDGFEGTTGNNTRATATRLSYIGSSSHLDWGDVNSAGELLVARAKLTKNDVDFFSFQQPADTTTAMVSVQTSNLSLLRTRVQVFDDAGKLIQSADASVYSGSASVMLKNLVAGKTYYAQVDALPGTRFAVGGYRIAVGSAFVTMMQQSYATMLDVGGSLKAIVSDISSTTSNNTIGQATALGRLAAGSNARWDVAITSQFDSATDVDVYKIETNSSAPPVLLATVWSESGADPIVEVKDDKGNVLKATVLANTSSSHVLQVEGIKTNTKYNVFVRSTNFGYGSSAKTYNLGLDLRADAIRPTAVFDTTLTSAKPQGERNFQVTRSQGFQFTLAATGTATSAVRLTVFDAAGKAVLTQTATGGTASTRQVLLAPGNYTVVIAGAAQSGGTFSSLGVNVSLMTLTDPIGPMLADEYAGMMAAPSAPDNSGSGSSSSGSDDSTDDADDDNMGYYWGYLMYESPTFGPAILAPSDPYGDPWW